MQCECQLPNGDSHTQQASLCAQRLSCPPPLLLRSHSLFPFPLLPLDPVSWSPSLQSTFNHTKAVETSLNRHCVACSLLSREPRLAPHRGLVYVLCLTGIVSRQRTRPWCTRYATWISAAPSLRQAIAGPTSVPASVPAT